MNLKLRPTLMAGSFGAVAGFVGGALIRAEWLTALGGAVIGAWSLIVGVLIVAPMAGQFGKDRIWSSFAEPTDKDLEGIDSLMMILAERAAVRLDEEMQAPTGSHKPVLAMTARLARVFRMQLEGEVAAMKGDVERKLRETGIGGAEGSYAERLGILKQAAKKAGREIPEALEGKADALAMVLDALGTSPGRGGREESRPRGKKQGWI